MNDDRYTRLIVLAREGELEVIPFVEGQEEEAEALFERYRQNWSDVYLCQVLKGPGPPD